MIPAFKLHIDNSAKLPLKISRGSEKQRIQKSNKLLDKFYKEIKNSGDNLTLEKCTEAIDMVLGKDSEILYKIKSEKKQGIRGYQQMIPLLNTSTYSLIDVSVIGHTIGIPMKDNVIADKYTLLHEVGHFFEAIYNPKYTINSSRVFKLLAEDDTANKSNAILNEFMNNTTYNNDFEENIKTKINELPLQIAIDRLQDVRCHMKTENTQYKNMIKYMLKKPVKNFYNILDELKLTIALKHKKKLEFANQLLKEKLAEARLK